ncbi:protein PIN-LIKES 3 isoform X1 [Daucus carota subsp. sativus]|uniref:protein PIN-LIKES 3 isoform X1 n=1 Tax=Daucus carota subsp. sativus TaxID=79200 RepID=UPI0007F0128F|nr:PREDICTED: protein PIN-LIKES 3-like isoform X1 [Daucus carota subsp. sativus]
MELLNLFVAASMPVLKVLLLTALGSFLALDTIDLLGEDARNSMNRIVFYVFSPALIGGNLANTITYESMIKLWFMPVNILFAFIVGSGLGWMVNLLTKPPPHLRGLVIGCCAAGNLGNILIIIIPAVCKESGTPFGAADVCSTYAMAYASLSMAIGAIYLWVYAYNVVRISVEASLKQVGKNGSSVGNSSIASSMTEPIGFSEPLLSQVDAVTIEHNTEALPLARFEKKNQLSLTDKIKHYMLEISQTLNLKKLFAPSTNAAIVGFVVGVVPWLRKLMIGDTAPLRVIEDSTILLGEGAIPALSLIIGANLLRGLRATGTQKSMVFGIVVARYIALPLAGIGIVKGLMRLNLVKADPLYEFVLLIQYAVPPAMNMGTITQMFGSGETECSVIMLWTYSLASISLTLWCTFFLCALTGTFKIKWRFLSC